jgi:hypothetical protein
VADIVSERPAEIIGIRNTFAMIGAGTIKDGKTIMLLQYAALHVFTS